MLIKAIRIRKIIPFCLLFIFLTIGIACFSSFANSDEETSSSDDEQKNFIRWVDFNVTAEALNLTAKLDISSHQKNLNLMSEKGENVENDNETNIEYNWIELLAYLACMNGGNFKNFTSKDLDVLVTKLQNGETMEDLTKNMKFYDYYLESYSAVLGGFIGYYKIEKLQEDGSKEFVVCYGLKAFLPIAKNYSFSHYFYFL